MEKKIKSIITSNSTGGGITFYSISSTGEVLKWEDRGTAAFDYSFVCSQVKKLLGQVLTVVDASYTNERQLKAVKDLIRNHFAVELSELWEMSEGNHEEIVKEATKNFTEKDLEKSVSLEEVLGA